MKKIIALFLLSFILICPVVAEDSYATTVFITSDNVMGHNADFEMMNQIKNYIESESNGDINVIVDEKGSSPGEGTRVMTTDCDYAITIAYACAGNLDILGKYASTSDKKITYVNAGSLDLNDINFLRRAYDDNWSNSSFAAIKNPGKFLNDSGITLLQPTQKYPEESNNGDLGQSSDKINKYIADSVLKQINSNSSNVNKQYDNDLIVQNTLNPKYLAEDSKKIANSYGSDMKENYGSYSTQQLLYMSSSYLVGYGLSSPGEFKAPENPSKYSILTKDSYSFKEYTEMADKVVDYMNEHKQAPDSIEYKGAQISYYDLVYNFALLTEDHNNYQEMNFPNEAEFHKFNDNFILNILPIAILIILIIAIIYVIRKIRKAIRIRKNKKNYRINNNRHQREFKENRETNYSNKAKRNQRNYNQNPPSLKPKNKR